MARLATIGFETQGATGPIEDPNLAYQAGATVTTTNARSGSAAGSLPNNASTPNFALSGFGANLDRNYYFRMYIRFSAATPAARVILCYPWKSGGGWEAVAWETDGTLSLYDRSGGVDVLGTKIGSSSAALSANTYYRVEFAWKIPTAGNGIAGLWLDGVPVAYSTNANLANAAYTEIDFGKCITADVAVGLVDDVALNDDTGTIQNGLAGPGKIVMLKPISDNARVGFTGGAGGTTNLFDAVNNYPPIGVISPGTNLQEIGDATNNATDTYDANVGAYSTAVASGGGGMTTSDAVTLVQAIGRGGNSTTTSRSFGVSGVSNPVISEGTKATGTTAAGTEPTGWTTQLDTVVYRPAVTIGTSPVLRVRKATASTDRILIDMMGLVVEYTGGSLPIPNPVHRMTRLRR